MTLTRINLALIAFLLMGYAFLDKGFAYVGFFPVFIGEIIFAVMLLITIITGTNAQYFRSPICQALLLFLAWEVMILVFYTKGTWVNAMRDSVTWAYAAFSLLIAGLLLRARALEQTLHWYGRWMPWFVVLAAPLFILADRFSGSIPSFPGTTVSILNIKGGDIGVHLGGAIAFFTLGLYRDYPPKKKRNWQGLKDIILVGCLTLGTIAIGSRSRGGLMSVVLPVAICFAFRPGNRLGRFILPAAVLIFLLSALDISIPTGYREISMNQILHNVESVVFEGGKGTKQQTTTVNWRLAWWEGIVKHTIEGPGFWHGDGFGRSLAVEYGFADDTGNRSPHDAHLTILARSGVPGLVLWVVFILTTYFVLLRGYVNATMNNQTTLAKVNLWIVAYLTAFLVNMSFDVYLEGPQGGIWFWSLIGYAIALTRAQRMNKSAVRETAAADYGTARVGKFAPSRVQPVNFASARKAGSR
jgi:O-Antigen ligase